MDIEAQPAASTTNPRYPRSIRHETAGENQDDRRVAMLGSFLYRSTHSVHHGRSSCNRNCSAGCSRMLQMVPWNWKWGLAAGRLHEMPTLPLRRYATHL